MHFEAFYFVGIVKKIFPEYFYKKNVCEVGSFHVNDSIRPLFKKCNYLGLDLTEGNGVDIVTSGAEFTCPNFFDVTISCECFEHNPFYFETFTKMIENLKPGGLLLFTCATTGRPEHGTLRTDAMQSPGTAAVGWDYYKNLVKEDFVKEEIMSQFLEYDFYTCEESQDLYFWGVKKSGKLESNSRDIQAIKRSFNSKIGVLKEHSKTWRAFWSDKTSNDIGRFERHTIFLNELELDCIIDSTLYWIIFDSLSLPELHSHRILILERYLFKYPESSILKCLLGWFYFKSNRVNEALILFESVLELDDKNFSALHGLGAIADFQDDKTGALNYFKLALNVKPNEKWLRDIVSRLESDK